MTAAEPAMPPPATTADPGLHLLVAGRRIMPEQRGDALVFRLHLPCGDVQLRSRCGRPSGLGFGPDTRMLGVRLTGLAVALGGRRLDLPLNHPDLVEGFHGLEPDGGRWTNGAAVLPGEMFHLPPGQAELHVLGTSLPHYALGSDETSALFNRFMSLGDNCEFAVVQRMFDADPMDLLRWASTDGARLVLGLCRRFEGLGDPAHTQLEFREDAAEYRLRDRRYLSMHTWALARLDDPAREEAMRLAGCARLRLLRRKLLADIQAGQRILVFKATQANPHPDSFTALHAALRDIGPAPLLCVTLAGNPQEAGRVEACGDGLFLASMDRFDTRAPSHELWREVCARTAALVDAAAGAGAVPA